MGPPLPDNTLDQPLPSPLAPHLNTLVSFQHRCHTLCQLLFTHLATALQTPPDWFTSRHDQAKGPSGTVFRMLYYPATKTVDGTDLRAGAHSDFGSLTLLFQLPGQPGLEIKTPEGHWASVPVDPSNPTGQEGETDKALPILVNIGDLLEDVSDHARSCGLIRTYRILILREVDRRPSKVHPPPCHLPSRTDRVPRPLLACVLLPPTRRCPARTSA